MNEKLFTLNLMKKPSEIEMDGKMISKYDVVRLLNEQQATIEQLQAKLKEKEEDERLYANEIVKLNKEAKEVLDFKSLGGDY